MKNKKSRVATLTDALYAKMNKFSAKLDTSRQQMNKEYDKLLVQIEQLIEVVADEGAAAPADPAIEAKKAAKAAKRQQKKDKKQQKKFAKMNASFKKGAGLKSLLA